MIYLSDEDVCSKATKTLESWYAWHSRGKSQALIQFFIKVFLEDKSINIQRATQVKCADLHDESESGGTPRKR